VSSTIYANLLRQLSSSLSLLRIDKSLTFPNFLPMAFSHNSFRIAIAMNQDGKSSRQRFSFCLGNATTLIAYCKKAK
jgi:hypothetical protein